MIIKMLAILIWVLETAFVICFTVDGSGMKKDYLFSTIVLAGVVLF